MSIEELSISEQVISINNDLNHQANRPLVLPALNQPSFSPEFIMSLMKEITRFGEEAEKHYKDLAISANKQRNIAVKDLLRAEERLSKQTTRIEQLEQELKTVKSELAESAKGYESTLIKLRNQMNDQISALNGSLTDDTSILIQDKPVDQKKPSQYEEAKENRRTLKSTAKNTPKRRAADITLLHIDASAEHEITHQQQVLLEERLDKLTDDEETQSISLDQASVIKRRRRLHSSR